jgi:hypothetical protein
MHYEIEKVERTNNGIEIAFSRLYHSLAAMKDGANPVFAKVPDLGNNNADGASSSIVVQRLTDNA